jgi:hypothetical protein
VTGIFYFFIFSNKNAPNAQIEAWFDRAVDAPTLDEVFRVWHINQAAIEPRGHKIVPTLRYFAGADVVAIRPGTPSTAVCWTFQPSIGIKLVTPIKTT